MPRRREELPPLTVERMDEVLALALWKEGRRTEEVLDLMLELSATAEGLALLHRLRGLATELRRLEIERGSGGRG